MSEFGHKTRCAGIPEKSIPLCKEAVNMCNGQKDELKPTCIYYVDECVKGSKDGKSIFELKTVDGGIIKYRSLAACLAAGPSLTELFGPLPDISKKPLEEPTEVYFSPDAKDKRDLKALDKDAAKDAEDESKEWKSDGWKKFELPFRLAIADTDSLNGKQEEEALIRFPIVYGNETLYPEFKIKYRLEKTGNRKIRMKYSIYGMGSRLADKSIVFTKNTTVSLALALTLKRSGQFEWNAVESIRIITK